MRTLSALVVLALAGCAGTPPTVAPPPPTVAVFELPPPPRMVVVALAEMIEVEPVEPPPVQEMRIDRRSVFEQAGAVEWTLANGLTVVYVEDETAVGYHARVVAPTGASSFTLGRAAVFRRGDPTWGTLTARIEAGERVATGASDGLQSLLDDAARLLTSTPDASQGDRGEALFEVTRHVRVFLLGSRDRAWIEPAVAATLGALRPENDALGSSAATDGDPSVRGDWDDLPAIWVLDAALAERAGPGTRVRFDAMAGRIRLESDGGTPRPVLLARFDDADLRRARDQAARTAASPSARLEAFSALYGLPGTFRPARNPVDAARLPERIARTPPSAAADLLRRLAAAR